MNEFKQFYRIETNKQNASIISKHTILGFSSVGVLFSHNQDAEKFKIFNLTL